MPAIGSSDPTQVQTTTVYRYGQILLRTVVFSLIIGVSPVAGQSSQPVGSDICGTPLADTINQAAPLIVGILMIGGAILSYILHNASAFPKDPQSVQAIKDWRNRAAFASITTPLFALVMELFIGFTGVGLAGCIDLVPFF
jgi:hypothetical protein